MRQIATKIAVLTAATVLVLACDAQAANVIVGDATGNAGSTVDVSVTVATEGEMVAGTQNDIGFMPGAAIAARANGRPDCTVNPAIDKGATTFAFQPPMCGMEGQPVCTGVRALVLSFDNVTPIPTGSVLYTCQIDIVAGEALDVFPLTCSNQGASDPDGGALPADCTNGQVSVGGVIPGESTLASAISATDTTIPLVDASTFPNSGTVKIGDELITYTGKDGNNLTGATRGTGGTTAVAHAAGDQVTLQQVVPPTATATPRVGTPTVTPPAGSPTRTLPPTVVPPINVCDDSCAITSPADARSGWLLLLPAAMLIWLRRRSR
jgi:hypothetical protein